MAQSDRHRSIAAKVLGREGLSRRRFLVSLGILAGGGIAGSLSRFATPRRGGIEIARPALGTWARISVRDADGARSSRAIERAFAAIRLVDDEMSIHRADTQLSRVNAAAGRHAVPVSPAVLSVVAMACDAARRSEGIYDPTILPVMRLYGFYGFPHDHYPTDREIARTLDAVGWRHAVLDTGAGTLGLDRPGVALDLGSIGKGWALDRAVDALRAEGISTALVDIGGKVYGMGAPDEEPEGWPVAVLHPVTGQVDHVFRLRDTAVATSGNTEQFQVLSGIRVGHLFDARRARPSNGHLSASTQARTGVVSDYLSTAAFLLGPDRFRGWPEALSTHFVG
jgi:thiamine biosynthesis lipoprotein